MYNKGLVRTETNNTTPNDISVAEKPLISRNNPVKKKVDINILKSKLQEHEQKEFKKNMFILVSFLILLGSLGIYLSL